MSSGEWRRIRMSRISRRERAGCVSGVWWAAGLLVAIVIAAAIVR